MTARWCAIPRSGTLVTLALIVGLAMPFVAPSAAASAAPSGQITGTVTDASTSEPVAGVAVQAYESGGNPVGSGQTAADGTYTISGLPTGSYKVGFVPGGNYVSQFYNGQATLAAADPVSVTAGSPTTGINAALAAGGQITGTVTDASTSAPLGNVEVDVYGPSGSLVTYTHTASDGTYEVPGLATGNYKVGFVPTETYLPQFYNGKANLATADPVSVTAGATTSAINAALAAGGQITGTVTDASTSAPVENVEVDLYDSTGAVVASAQTASDGTYTISGLATGTYKVGFVPTETYLPQFYNGKATLAAADPVSVTAGSPTTGINAALAAGGQITGTVTDASTSAPVGNVEVDAYDSGGSLVASSQTASDGTYTISGLPTGSYHVGFVAGGNYVSQFYNGKATLAAADPVSVTAGSTTSSINAALATGGQITGTVTDASTSTPVAAVFVQAYDSGGNLVGTGQTASDGTYTISGLPTGSYHVGFVAGGNYVSQFYNGKATLATADPVSVTAGSTTSSINAALAVSGSGQISGTVTDASTSAPVENVEVEVYDSTGEVVSAVQTAPDGTYIVPGLATGTYKVGFVPTGNYLPQFYNGQAMLAAAEPVSVTAGSTTSAINAALAAGGQITGTVTDASTSSPVGNVEVDLYDSSGGFLASTQTAPDGTYTFLDLVTGSYKVGFVPTGNYVSQFYNGKANLATADPVSVTAGATTSAINAALAAGGQITGTVTDASTSAGVLNVEVDVYDSSGNPVASGQTASDGTYTVSALPSGTYKVGFIPFGTNHLPQFYNGKANLATADPVSVTAGATTSAINAALAAGGQITGTVTDASTSAAVENVEVDAYDSGGSLVASSQTASDGTYTISGLPTGSYHVGFVAGGNYVSQFYNGQATLTAADPVSVTAGSLTTGINAALAAGGQITGTVTDASTSQPVAGVFVQAYDSGGNPVGSSQTATDGTYTIAGLPSGSYKVGFVPSGSYSPQFYNGKATLATADSVSVTSGLTTSAIDAALAPIPQPPSNQSLPTVSGTATQGQMLSEAHGTWTNSPTGYVYQWEDCDGAGGGCSAIVGATSPSYTLAASDVGHTIRVQETASNGGGSSSPASSAQTAVVQPPPPSNQSLPTVSGAAQQGQELTAVNGSWTNSPTSFTHQWQRCDASGNDCAAIPGATGQTYTLTAADVGSMIRVQETASNAAGVGTPASSAAVGPVIAPPANTAPPTISGAAQQGQTLTEAQGVWTNSPISYGYQWNDCDRSGYNCTPIAGATGQTYTVTVADVGSTIRVQETASNAAGSGAPATSAQTALVQAPPSSSNGSTSGGGDTSGGGGSTGGGGTTSGKGSATVSSAQIAALLAQQITPRGKAAKIASLLKTGGFTLTFKALEAGTAVIDWYHVPHGVKLAKKTKARPVLVASGKLTFSAAGTATIKINLTAAGRRLLKHAKRLKLTAKDTFTPIGKTPISATKVFVLK